VTLTDDEKLAAQAAYAQASRTCDIEALVSLSDPDAVVWHNYDDVVVSAEQSNKTLRWLHRSMPDVTWKDVAVRPTLDGFVWQAILSGTAPGGPVRAHTCLVVTLSDDGKVQRTEEYLDTVALKPLTG
jgi:ketosteroid isomerase-like protein